MAFPWILAANASNRVMTVGTQVLVGFLLVPDQVGTFAVAAALAGMASPFQSADHARLALQDPVSARVTAAILRNWLLIGSGVAAVVAFSAAYFLHLAVALAPLACLALLSLLRVLANVRVVLLSHAGRSGAIAIAGACEGNARSLSLVGTALLGAGMWSLVFGEVAAVATSTILLDRMDRGPGRGTLRLPRWVLKNLAATIGICLLVGVELNCSAFAIGQFCDTHSVGSFAFANRIANQLTLLVLPLVACETIPRLLAAKATRDGFTATSRREIRRMGMIIAILVLPLVIIGPTAMGLVWGTRWAQAAEMLRWLALSIGFRLAYVMAKAHLEAFGAFHVILLLSILDTALILTVAVGAGMTGGALTVVQALMCESAVIFAVATLAVRHRLRLAYGAHAPSPETGTVAEAVLHEQPEAAAPETVLTDSHLAGEATPLLEGTACP
jgi:PST family polysaccharide transporter